MKRKKKNSIGLCNCSFDEFQGKIITKMERKNYIYTYIYIYDLKKLREIYINIFTLLKILAFHKIFIR